MDTEALVLDAFAEIGVETHGLVADAGADLIIDPDGTATRVEIKTRALVDEITASNLIAARSPSDATLLVVGDRVTDGARRVLSTSGVGYLDLRGHLALRTPGLIVDTKITPIKERSERSDALSGAAGLEVATALLMQPERPASVRELARSLNRAPSTISTVLTALRRDHLIDAKNVITDGNLFWRVVERWDSPRTQLVTLPEADDATVSGALRFNVDDLEGAAGWALTDSAAAAAYGAPVGFRSGQVMDFLVPDQSVVRRATMLLHTAQSPAQVRATVRAAPVPRAVTQRVNPAANPFDWPLTHPLFAALDLAQDTGRGREILSNWTPGKEWTRVW